MNDYTFIATVIGIILCAWAADEFFDCPPFIHIMFSGIILMIASFIFVLLGKDMRKSIEAVLVISPWAALLLISMDVSIAEKYSKYKGNKERQAEKEKREIERKSIENCFWSYEDDGKRYCAKKENKEVTINKDCLQCKEKK